MSNCATHIKRINPLTGQVIVYDTATGQVVSDPAVIAALTCCPERVPDKEKVCAQPIGNVDPALIVPAWRVTVNEIAADGTITVISTKLYDVTLSNDITATHEQVECPDTTPIDVPLCLPAAP